MADEKKKQKNAVDVVSEPMGAEFKFKAVRKVGKEELVKRLAGVPNAEIVELKDRVALIKIDSRDIDNVPYLFTIVYFGDQEIEVMYTVTPEISMRRRRIELLRYVANLLSVLGDAYDVDIGSFMQLLDMFLEEIKEFATHDYESLYVKYDALMSKVEELNARVRRLKESNEKLGKDLLEIKNERDRLKVRVEQLEKYSDEALMLKVQEWIREHDNEINIRDFCRLYKVGESRVEQILNKMVREGYLEIRR